MTGPDSAPAERNSTNKTKLKLIILGKLIAIIGVTSMRMVIPPTPASNQNKIWVAIKSIEVWICYVRPRNIFDSESKIVAKIYNHFHPTRAARLLRIGGIINDGTVKTAWIIPAKYEGISRYDDYNSIIRKGDGIHKERKA